MKPKIVSSPLLVTQPCHRRNAGYKLVLADVQIVLPVASFAPLFALAWVGGVSNLTSARLGYSFWAALQHPILDGISVFDVDL